MGTMKFMLSWVEHENRFITSGLKHRHKITHIKSYDNKQNYTPDDKLPQLLDNITQQEPNLKLNNKL